MQVVNGKTVCELNQCCGCSACVDICPKNAITIKDTLKAYNAVIDTDKCVNCDACTRVCQQNNRLESAKPIQWHQGWCKDGALRRNGSSGGACGALATAFVRMGGVVCSCVFKDGEFGFSFADNLNDIEQFASSKYVKSNPKGVYKELRKRLLHGEKVLFIGLPCQVAAVKLFVGEKLQVDLYTADLICHGTPSPQLLEIFLRQYGRSLNKIQDIRFRIKGGFQVYEGYKGVITTGVTDKYLIAFLNSLTYTDNCYSCHYAKTERVSDLTLGDSWGTNLTREEQKQGISLILAQTEKGSGLLDMAGFHLEEVDVDNAIHNNHQLYEPSRVPESRDSFFEGIERGKRFNSLVLSCFPKACLKQDIKCILIKTGLRKSGGEYLNYGIMIKDRGTE